MPRSAATVRRRLQEAAVELCRQQGYDRTTAEQIAARAGVTERTFFRHFADKREVLFDGEQELIDLLTRSVAATADGTDPMVTLKSAFHDVVPLLVRNRPVTEPRAQVIADNPALRERALAKSAHLVDVLSQGLVARGVEQFTAQLCARVALGVFDLVGARWMTHPDDDLHALLDDAFAELRTVVDATGT